MGAPLRARAARVRRPCVHERHHGGRRAGRCRKPDKGHSVHLIFNFRKPTTDWFPLTDWVAEIEGTHLKNEHVACWQSINELRQKIDFFLMHEAEKPDIVHCGHDHFLRNHSWAVRAKRLFNHWQRSS
jgi:hypothetical protein